MKQQIRLFLTVFVVTMSCLATFGQVASSSPYTLDQSVIASGGETSASAPGDPVFSITGTIGQAAAGTEMTNSPYAQLGGFWTWLDSAAADNAPTISKSFSPSTINVNGASSVTLTLTNRGATAQTNASFTDTLTNMSAAGGAVTGTCADTIPATLSAGDTALSFSGITIPALGSCTVVFSVTSNAPGAHPNTTSGVTTTQTTTAGAVSNTATLTVVAPPQITKSFSPSLIPVGGISTLTITITNPSVNTAALTGVGVTDAFPAGMKVDAIPSATNSCSAGSSFAPTAADTTIVISAATIPAGASCAFTVKVKGTTAGTLVNTTGNVTSSNGGTGGTASATLTVGQAASYSISGTVGYATTPTGDPAVFVPDVTMTAAGTPQATDTTDSLGAYLLSGLGAGSYTVIPGKAAQTTNTGISLQDASEVAKYVFNQRTFTPNQLIAADATGDGTVSLQDASEIAKRAFNIASNNIVGQWKFVPASRIYPSLSSNQSGQNYEAILIGDVTGNWTPQEANRLEAAENESTIEGVKLFVEDRRPTGIIFEKNNQSADRQSNRLRIEQTSEELPGGTIIPVNLPEGSGIAGTVLLIPVTVGNLTSLDSTSYDLTVSFDPTVLEPASPAFDTAGTLTAAAGGYSVFVDEAQPDDRFRVGAFGTAPLAGSGVLVYLRFNILPGAAKSPPLDIVEFRFIESPPAASTTVTRRLPSASKR